MCVYMHVRVYMYVHECVCIQGKVTPIDSVLTPTTTVKKFDLNLGP